MQGTRMGDRYHRSKPQKSDEKREKRQKRDEAQQKFKVSNKIGFRPVPVLYRYCDVCY
jgi:hypothetical protein